jgi:hypothetical protein
MQPFTAPSSYPPTSYSLTSHDQSSCSQQNHWGQLINHGQQSSYGQQSTYGSSLPLYRDSSVRFQINLVNRAAATGGRIHSDRTTPVAWVFMGRSLEDFLDQEKT